MVKQKRKYHETPMRFDIALMKFIPDVTRIRKLKKKLKKKNKKIS